MMSSLAAFPASSCATDLPIIMIQTHFAAKLLHDLRVLALSLEFLGFLLCNGLHHLPCLPKQSYPLFALFEAKVSPGSQTTPPALCSHGSISTTFI